MSKEINYKEIEKTINNIENFNPDKLSIRDLGRIAGIVEKKLGISYIRMDMGVPGLKAPQIAIDAQKKALTPEKAAQYVSFAGIDEIKESASLFVETFLKKKIDPKHFIPTIGAMHGNGIAFEIAGRRIEDKKTIITIDPDFALYKLQIKKMGLKTASIDKYEMTSDQLLEELEKLIIKENAAAIIWSSPSNPSWQIMSEKELIKIAEFADKYNLVLIEDNAYFGFDSRNREYLDPKSNKIAPSIINYSDKYVATFSGSKIFSFAGERVGFALIAPGLAGEYSAPLEKMYGRNNFLDCYVQGGLYSNIASAPQSAQYGFAALLNASVDGTFNINDHIAPYIQRSKKLKELFIKAGFEILYKTDLDGKPIADGFYFTITHPKYENLGSKLLFNLLKCGLTAVPLNIFGCKNKNGLRICSSLVPMEMMDELEKRLKIFSGIE